LDGAGSAAAPKVATLSIWFAALCCQWCAETLRGGQLDIISYLVRAMTQPVD
jgi:hypothetical protein